MHAEQLTFIIDFKISRQFFYSSESIFQELQSMENVYKKCLSKDSKRLGDDKENMFAKHCVYYLKTLSYMFAWFVLFI